MNLTAFTGNNAATMSSKEIAELTGKEHKHVLTDVEKLISFYTETYSAEKAADLVKSGTYKDTQNREYRCFHLSKDAALDLVTGYSIEHRHAVNQRWQELESQQRQHQVKPLPSTYLTALKALVVAEEEKEAALTEVNNLLIKLDEHADYATVKKMEAIFSRKFSWRPLKAKSLEMGFKLFKAEDSNYESGVNVYHKDVWKIVYGIDIKQHLRMKDGRLLPE